MILAISLHLAIAGLSLIGVSGAFIALIQSDQARRQSLLKKAAAAFAIAGSALFIGGLCDLLSANETLAGLVMAALGAGLLYRPTSSAESPNSAARR